MAFYQDGWTFSGHADLRRVQMRLTRNDVMSAVLEPERVYPSHKPGLQCNAADGIVVVINPDTKELVTVLWDGAIGRDIEGQPVTMEVGR